MLAHLNEMIKDSDKLTTTSSRGSARRIRR